MPDIPANNPLEFTVTFLDKDNAPFDPTSGIKVVVNNPRGVSTTYLYPTSLIKDSVGVYHVIVPTPTGGDWRAYGQGQLANGMLVTTEDVVKYVRATQVSG